MQVAYRAVGDRNVGGFSILIGSGGDARITAAVFEPAPK